jgi:cyclin-dependent kinase 12/13
MTSVPQEWCLELPSEGKSGENTFGGCRRIEDAYERVGQLGQGTYGEVFKAKDKETGEIVAVKKIKMENEKEGFPITAVREIKILSKLAASDQELLGELMRNNIIRLREIVRSDAHASNSYKGSVFMVFDYMEHDLAGLLDRANQARVADAKSRGLPPNKADPPFHMGQVKRYMKQLLLGLALLQCNRILHRDLKNANLLVSNKGELKIADFGLARSFYHRKISDDKDGVKPPQPSNGPALNNMTNRVITLWYRPPELCLGTEQYGLEVDMWSAGCILAEMLTGKPLFPGKDEVEQVKLICSVLGSPNENSMPGCTSWKECAIIMLLYQL